jgi:ribonuclease J
MRGCTENGALRDSGWALPEYNDFLSENEAMLSPRDKIVMICTGCQGEPRSALWRIATDDHNEVELDEGDTVIFSSRDIPGNEKQIARLQNRLVASGLKIITQYDAPVHVSGHPAQDELAQLYQWTRPRLVLPVHGETRHQIEHERIAKECQVPHTLIPANGQIIRLGPGIHEVVAEVAHGRMALDGKVLRKLDHEAAKSRRKMSFNGAVVMTLVLDVRGKMMQDPQVTLMGLADENTEAPLRNDVAAAIMDALQSMPKSTRIDDNAVRHAVATAARRLMQESYGKKPVMDVHLVRI